MAFLVSWLVNRGVGSLYLGSIIVALAAPELLEAAGIVSGSGVGTLCLGVAFLFIAAVRWVSGGGIGWQAALGGLLAIIGASSFAFPAFNALFWPLVLVIIGGLLLFRASRAGLSGPPPPRAPRRGPRRSRRRSLSVRRP